MTLTENTYMTSTEIHLYGFMNIFIKLSLRLSQHNQYQGYTEQQGSGYQGGNKRSQSSEML